MNHTSVTQDKTEQEQHDSNKLKRAHVFDSQKVDIEPGLREDVKPAVIISALDSIEVNDEQLEDNSVLQYSEEDITNKKVSKWVIFLFISVLLASSAELVIFIINMVEQLDWLAAFWLIIFAMLSVFVFRKAFVEYTGLKQLKRQSDMRGRSEAMSKSSVIGLAEEHCLTIAKGLSKDHQHLVANWRDSLEPHLCDSEVLNLFEYQVLAPIDQLAMKQVSKNSSAASVMIAVSPFALLDMLIVLWRNIRMMNQVSEIYGLHLGYYARVKLIRKILHTMLYAGAAEILSDAGNYALSAGVTGKLSTRVAQGMGAGILTARIGLKAINESRPLPWLSQTKPGLSGISKQLLTDLNKQIK